MVKWKWIRLKDSKTVLNSNVILGLMHTRRKGISLFTYMNLGGEVLLLLVLLGPAIDHGSSLSPRILMFNP
jgi:hypothetical protein